MSTTAGALILILSVLGFLNASYFVLVTYGFIAPDPRWLPTFCRMDEGTCASIVTTRYASVFGLPNALYGMVWYVATACAGVSLLATGRVPFCLPLIGIALGTVVLGVYLAWALLSRLRVACVLCFFGHGVNTALLLLFVLVCRPG